MAFSFACFCGKVVCAKGCPVLSVFVGKVFTGVFMSVKICLRYFEIGQTYFEICPTYFEICPTFFFFAPSRV